VFAQESFFAQMFRIEYVSNGCPVYLVQMALCEMVPLLPHLQKLLTVNHLIQVLFVHPGQFVAPKVDMQSLISQRGRLRSKSFGNSFSQQVFGSGIHLHIEFSPSVGERNGSCLGDP
jgi:hypothetical protein